MVILSEISENLQIGKAKVVKELVQQAVDEGSSPEQILNEGHLAGMSIIGEKSSVRRCRKNEPSARF